VAGRTGSVGKNLVPHAGGSLVLFDISSHLVLSGKRVLHPLLVEVLGAVVRLGEAVVLGLGVGFLGGCVAGLDRLVGHLSAAGEVQEQQLLAKVAEMLVIKQGVFVQ
jgi:hypothetical protein